MQRTAPVHTLFRYVVLSLALSILPGDPIGAAQDPFAIPDALKPDVQFWIRVFSEIDAEHGFIHDSRRLDIVYETVSVPAGISRRQRDRLIEQVKTRYRTALRALAEGKRTDLTRDEQRIRNLWGRNASPKTLLQAADRLRFQLGQSDRFREGYIRSGLWRAHIESTLQRHGVPASLIALPHVESSFNPDVYSHRGAAGLWQFIRSTGKRYLRVDHVVDERMDPFQSTEAAARLLKHNFETTGSWPLAITAYNHGAAGVRRAVRTVGTHDIARIVREYQGKRFRFASRNYYVAFLAAREIEGNPQRYLGKVTPRPPQASLLVTMPAYVSVDTLQDTLGIARGPLKNANPALRKSVWRGDKFVPKGFELRVSCTTAAQCRKLDNVLAERLGHLPATHRHAHQKPDLYHRVQSGQTLSGIAARYGVPLRELVAVNDLRDRHRIRAGQTLRLPRPPGTLEPAVLVTHAPEPSPAAPPWKSTAPETRYQVARGDTLSEIAQRFNVEQAQLMRWNGITEPDLVRPGQTLSIQAESSDSETTAATCCGNDDEAAADVALADSPVAAESRLLVAAAAETSHPALAADPSDYTVAADGTVEVQTDETLGHYADWLEVPTASLRRMNHLSGREPVVLGRRLKLAFGKVSRQEFEARRTAYHQALQEAFFESHRIVETREHVVREGDSVWVLVQREYRIPFWLFHQYNPDRALESMRPGVRLTIPVIQPRKDTEPDPRVSPPAKPREIAA